MRIGYFPIREGVNLSAFLFPIRIVLSGLGLPVGASQLCSPGSVVLSDLGGLPGWRKRWCGSPIMLRVIP